MMMMMMMLTLTPWKLWNGKPNDRPWSIVKTLGALTLSQFQGCVNGKQITRSPPFAICKVLVGASFCEKLNPVIHRSKCICLVFLLQRAPPKTSSYRGRAQSHGSCFSKIRPVNFVMALVAEVSFVTARRFVEYRSLAFTFWWRMLLALFSQLFTGWWWRPGLVVSLCICWPGTFWVFR